VEKKEVLVASIHHGFFTVDAPELAPNEWLVSEGAAYLNDLDTVKILTSK